ncbi:MULTISPECIES: alpha/beta hydrolase [Sphingomonadales]|uniref:alpha/beta hydrolase n=1 Tax=Sphingomonadales TaxID=204457 RepID=UPI00093AE9E8|nr:MULTISPECIES: alpha/beta fold hydrolase [Sphingomonadales]
MIFSALGLSLGGCTAVISQASFYPSASLAAPNAVLAVPDGYTATDTLLPLGDLGAVRTVRLDNPASETAIIYSAGNGGFVDSEGTSRMAARLAEVTGADIILYDYPGRGGTILPTTIEAAAAFGPAMIDRLKSQGWIGNGPVYAYGLSFGGAMTASLAQAGGLAGLIIEGSAADYQAVGRDFVPGLAKPFVKLRLDPALGAFDYQGYVMASRAPVLLLSGTKDKVIRPPRMREFQLALEGGGTKVTFAPVPVGHGGALEAAEGRAALAAFISAR